MRCGESVAKEVCVLDQQEAVGKDRALLPCLSSNNCIIGYGSDGVDSPVLLDFQRFSTQHKKSASALGKVHGCLLLVVVLSPARKWLRKAVEERIRLCGCDREFLLGFAGVLTFYLYLRDNFDLVNRAHSLIWRGFEWVLTLKWRKPHNLTCREPN